MTPGFIDSHSHSDSAVFEYPEMIEKIEQGITTSIGGQCGITSAPARSDIPDIIGGYGKKSEVCKTFGSMMNVAKDIPLGSNLLSFVGHSALRKVAVGYENRKPTASELEHMKALLREAMENGALGVSFGLIYTPSCYAETDELIELAKVVKEYEGLISAHVRNEGFELMRSVEEFLTVVRAVDVKAVISHHKAMHKENWGKVSHTLRMIEDAVNDGFDVYCDVYPYIASQTTLSATVIAKELRDTDNAGIVKNVSDPVLREQMRELYCSKYDSSLENLQISSCANHPEYEGRRISEIAKSRGVEPFDMAMDIIAESNATANICNFAMCEEDLERVLKFERSMICTDSSVAKNLSTYHPRLRGTFPRVLGRYVRERGTVKLPEMIRKCTSMPASVYGLASKGILKVGFDADICIFDADTIIDKADFKDCHERCTGLSYVILGGEVVVEDAMFNGVKNGKFIAAQR